MPGVGRLLQDGAHLDSSGLSGASRASQPSRVPSGCCVHRRAATRLHGMASGNNDFLFSPSVSLFPFPSSWLMVAQAGPDQWREVALFLSDLSPRWPASGPFVHPAVSVSPDSQLSSLDTTFPRDTDLSGFTHSHSRLARAHAEQGRGGGDTRFFPSILFSLVQRTWPPRLQVGSRPVTGPEHLFAPVRPTPTRQTAVTRSSRRTVASTAGGAAAARQLGPGTAAIQMLVAVDR